MAEPSNVFGPVESADATRQAQHSRSDDSPTDVNNNASLARFQGLIPGLASAEFQAAAARRTQFGDLHLKPGP